MSYTLIASIGTGMYDKIKNDSTGYRLTTYKFQNNKEITSRLFLFSILESKNWDINQVILVGSKTSSWDALIAQDCEENDQYLNTWMQLVDECERSNSSGVSDSSLDLLSEYLSQRFGIKFTLFSHDSIVDNETLHSIFPIYRDIASEIISKNSILLDITHGFRSMPMFLYQSLRFSSINQSFRDVSILYGEYIPGRSVSLVRDLSKFWEFSEASEAFELFESSFAGESLAVLLEGWCPKGAAWMKVFTSIIKTNYVLQIEQSINQLGNALSSLDVVGLSLWKKEIYVSCTNLYKRFSKLTCLSEKILVLSDLLLEKQLYTQSIIALQISVETRIVESAFDSAKIGDYEYWNAQGGPKEYKYDLQMEHGLYSLRDLEHERNKIAHGGGLDSWKSSPKKDGIIKYEAVKTYRESVEILFSLCKVKQKI